jgi:DNA polymerase III sliding clamp (beta) subunit (PCNA family)
MTFTANRKTLLDAARKAYRAVGKSPPILTTLHIRADSGAGVVRVTGTDYDTAIRSTVHADVENSGEAAVGARLLIGILEKMRGDDVRFWAPDVHTVTMSSGTAEFNLSAMPASAYPNVEIPIPGETVAVSGLKRLIEATAFAAEAGEPGGGPRPYTRCVKLTLDDSGIRAAATDGYRIAETTGDPEAAGSFSALIPAQSMKTLASMSGNNDVHQFGVSAEGKSAVFFDGTTLFSTRIVESEQLNIDNVFNAFKSAISAEIEADKLKSAVRNVTALASGSDALELIFRDGDISLRCKSGDSIAATSVPAAVTLSDNPALYDDAHCYSSKLLSECAKTLNGTVRLDMGENGMLMLRHGSTRYIQIPARQIMTNAQKPANKTAEAA